MNRFLMTLLIGILASGLCYGAKRRPHPGKTSERLASALPSGAPAGGEKSGADICEGIANGRTATGEFSPGSVIGDDTQAAPRGTRVLRDVGSRQPGDTTHQ